MANKSFFPVGVPRDYAELSLLFTLKVENTSRRCGLSSSDVILALKENRVLESFDFHQHAPPFFDRKSVLLYMGLSSSQWTRLLAATEIPDRKTSLPAWKRRPLRVDGDGGPVDVDAFEALYWAPDIISMRESLGEHIPVPRPICLSMANAFMAHLEQALSLLPSSKAAIPTGSPDDPEIPRNAEEMQIMYGDYVTAHVRRISKIRTEEEIREVVQHIWSAILGSDVLGKFLLSARSKLPRTLTLEEALGYLGITKDQWTSVIAYRKRHNTWVPEPVRGPSDEGLLFLTADIQTLDASNFLKGPRKLPRKFPEASSRGFKSYLITSINNHFKNLLRTRSRKHKEHCLDATTTLVPSGSGTYRRTYSEDGSCWEDNLVSAQPCDMESMIDLATELRRKGVDPRTSEGSLVLDFMTRRGMTINMAVRSASQG